jgi:hypothetical protein
MVLALLSLLFRKAILNPTPKPLWPPPPLKILPCFQPRIMLAMIDARISTRDSRPPERIILALVSACIVINCMYEFNHFEVWADVLHLFYMIRFDDWDVYTFNTTDRFQRGAVVKWSFPPRPLLAQKIYISRFQYSCQHVDIFQYPSFLNLGRLSAVSSFKELVI